MSASGTGVVWDDGSQTPVREITKSGLYWVQTETDACIQTDSIKIKIINIVHPQLRDTVVCQGNEYTIDITSLDSQYHWPDGSTAPIFLVNKSGKIAVNIENEFCHTTVEVTVTFNDAKVALNADTLYRFYSPVILSPGNADEIIWQDNSTTPTYTATEAGEYSFQATLYGCHFADTVTIL